MLSLGGLALVTQREMRAASAQLATGELTPARVDTCRVETSEKALGRVGAALGASGSPGGRAELLVLRKSLSPAGPPPDKPFSFAGF